MGFFNSWQGLPVFCWAYDTPEAWQDEFGKDLYQERLNDYSRVYDDEIAPILFEMGMKFNLGGEQEKSRLETTSRPIGVFDFSLASQGLYRVQEYYSEELANDYPNLFETFELPSGVVPPNLVDNIVIGGIKNYVYNHNGKTYVLDKRQKGTTAINDGVKDAKLKFATTTKDVYLKFKRVGGKVKYAEIYSLFYFTSLEGDDEYAIRHLPALMTAEYFESIGIKTRVYMTRFCHPVSSSSLRKYDILTNAELPMYTQYTKYTGGSNRFDDEIIFAPIIVKDFGQELDWKSCLAVSQSNSYQIYDDVIKNMVRKEVDRMIEVYGDPDQTHERYLEAFARYKEKYQIYVKAGIWKSKEIQEDSQLFFHSESIRIYLTRVKYSVVGIIRSYHHVTYRWKNILDESVVLQVFFEWWMKTSASRCRDTLMIMNAKEPRKEMQKVIDDLKSRTDEINSYLTIVAPQTYNGNTDKDAIEREIAQLLIRENYVKEILKKEGVTQDFNGEYNYENYLNRIIQDSTTYASNPLFPTDDETIERLNERADLLYNDIKLRS